MFLYESYCYDSLSDVGNQILSAPFLPNGAIVESVSYPNSTDITVTTDAGNITVTPPACDHLGFANSFTGLTVADATDLSWLIIAMLTGAYCIAAIRRCL